MRKPAFCIGENKDADQLCGNREADQPLCFRYTDSTISLLPKYKISSLQPSSVAVQPGLCGTWSETPKTGFLTTRLIYTELTKWQSFVTTASPDLRRRARWLSGKASYSAAKGQGFKTYLRRVVSLSKTLYSPKVLVIPRKRWLRPDMTEKNPGSSPAQWGQTKSLP